MSWEFRIFVPIDSAPLLFPALEQITSSTTSNSTLSSSSSSQLILLQKLLDTKPGRTDDYLLIDHCVMPSTGIKLRGGTSTEIKLRTGMVPFTSSDQGTPCEKWKKYPNVTKQSIHSDKWNRDLVSFLYKNGCIPIQAPLTINAVVSMTKTRQKYRYTTQNSSSVSVTLDLLRCSKSSFNNDASTIVLSKAATVDEFEEYYNDEEEDSDDPRSSHRVSKKRKGSHNDSDGEEMKDKDVNMDVGARCNSTWVSMSLEGNAVHVQTAMNELNVMEFNITNEDNGKKIVYGGYPTFAEHYSRHCLNI